MIILKITILRFYINLQVKRVWELLKLKSTSKRLICAAGGSGRMEINMNIKLTSKTKCLFCVREPNFSHYKFITILIAIIALEFIMNIFIPGTVISPSEFVSYAANGREYYISGYKILVNIEKDGSCDVEERLTYSFSGKFNGVTLNIDLSGTGGIEDPQVFINRNGEDIKAKEDTSGTAGTYEYNLSNNTATFKIYEPSQDEEKTFVYKYRLKDAVIKYNDIAEFNRAMIGTSWDVPIKNVYIEITIPDGASQDEIRVFAHGPLIGESEIISSNKVVFRISTVPSHTFIETRILFPTKLVPESKNVVAKDALQDILDSEKVLAEKSNIERENARNLIAKEEDEQKRLSTIGNILYYILLPLWFIIILSIYFKYDREFKRKFFGEYYRELPGDYTPAEMSVLMNMGKVQPRDIMATLMDLVRKKYLLIEKVEVDKKSLLGSKKVTDYKLSLNKEKSGNGLKSHESFLIDWFINEIGNGNEVFFNDIKEYSKGYRTGVSFKNDFDLWCEKAETEAKKNNFFDNSAQKGKIIGIVSSVIYIAAGIALPNILYTSDGLILLFLGIVLLLYSIRIKKRSAYGNEQYAMWNAFKRFLKDFSRLKEAEIPSIVIWEHYLVYAVSLGVAKEVIKQLPLVFKDNDLNNPNLTFLYGMSYGYLNAFERAFDDAIRTVESSVSSAKAIASSKNSSSSGRGGGFSVGSSGGGGHGGGGGAF